MPHRLPNDSDRTVILGHTGSGKSVAGIWHLSQRSWHRMPWIIFDPKRDDLLADLKDDGYLQEIRIDQKPPRKPGLYITHFVPESIDTEHVERMLASIIDGRNTGIYMDEGFTMPQRPPRYSAMARIQMQGRSKKVPTITLSQRPTWMNKSVWSEASYFQYFGLTNKSDRKTAEEFIGIDTEIHPPRFCSWWWDVARQEATKLQPVPDPDTIRQIFHDRMGRRPPRFL